MKLQATVFWVSAIVVGLSAPPLVRNSAAQISAATPAQAASGPTITVEPVLVPTAPDVKQDGRPEQLAVCKKLQAPLAETAVDEIGKLMIHVIANDIFFTGGAYILFELGADGKPTGAWMPCVQVRHVNGLTAARPKAPYYETMIPELLGISATCPKEAPGPAACKAVLADYLSAKGLIAIGSPRITDLGSGTTTTSIIWVPYAIKI